MLLLVLVCSINLFSSHSFWWSHTHCIKLVFESTTINNSFSFHIVHGRPHTAHAHIKTLKSVPTPTNIHCTMYILASPQHTAAHTTNRMKFINHMNRNVYGPNKTFSITMHPPECSSVNANKCYYGLYSFIHHSSGFFIPSLRFHHSIALNLLELNGRCLLLITCLCVCERELAYVLVRLGLMCARITVGVGGCVGYFTEIALFFSSD